VSDISEDELYEMANVFPDDSGLSMTVWVRPRSNERHGPRIKVCTVPGPRMLPHDTVTVTLSRPIRVIPPKVLASFEATTLGGLAARDLHDVFEWIRLNEAAITAHWEGRISAIEFGRRLHKLP